MRTGDTTVGGNLIPKLTVEMLNEKELYWHMPAGNPALIKGDASNYLTLRGGTAGLRIVDQSSTTTSLTVNDSGQVFVGNIPSSDVSGRSLISVTPIVVVSGVSNASTLTLSQAGGYANVTSSHSTAGTTLPLQLLVNSTPEARFLVTGTDRTCIYIDGSLRVLSLSGGAVIDGGACP